MLGPLLIVARFTTAVRFADRPLGSSWRAEQRRAICV